MRSWEFPGVTCHRIILRAEFRSCWLSYKPNTQCILATKCPLLSKIRQVHRSRYHYLRLTQCAQSACVQCGHREDLMACVSCTAVYCTHSEPGDDTACLTLGGGGPPFRCRNCHNRTFTDHKTPWPVRMFDWLGSE
jgi:hypothetical protein